MAEKPTTVETPTPQGGWCWCCWCGSNAYLWRDGAPWCTVCYQRPDLELGYRIVINPPEEKL